MKVRASHKDISPGAARLSSACILRRSLKWGNMRNPYRLFYMSNETAWDNQEEGEDDAKSAWPFDVLGCTHDTMEPTAGRKAARQSKSLNGPPVRIEVCNSTS